MAERTSVTTDAQGRRVVAKLAGDAEEAARIEREASLLEAARHPGVVELVGVDGHGVGSILLTAHIDGPTLAEVGRLPLEEASGLLAALASTLADLHALGLVHGAVSPDHVVVGPGGRPVVCSLGYGGRAGDPAGPVPALAEAFTDPARADAGVLSPVFDVFALGALARFLTPAPPAGHVLGRLAADALCEEPSARPTARAMADALQQEVPAARLPRGPASQSPARAPSSPSDPLAAWRGERGGLGGRRRPLRPPAVVMTAAVAAVAAVGGTIFLTGSGAGPEPAPVTELSQPQAELPHPPPPDETQPGPTTTRVGLGSSSTTTAVVALRLDCRPNTAVLQADIDGDGCPEALRYTDGILEAGDVRWSVGRAGDQVATGDWACQGSRTIALFRPSTGEIFGFDGWAGQGLDLTATAVARIPGGQALRAADVDRDGCHEAVIERGTGVAEIIRLPRSRP